MISFKLKDMRKESKGNSRQRRRLTGYQKGYQSNASRKWSKSSPVGDMNDSNPVVEVARANTRRQHGIIAQVKAINPYMKHIGSKPIAKLLNYIRRAK